MHQVVKGKEWHFGMKAHVGTDRRGIVHTLTTTPANVPSEGVGHHCFLESILVGAAAEHSSYSAVLLAAL